MGDRLVAWDIDGTLIRAGAVAREAFGRAVARVLGRAEDEVELVAMSGKTDPQIAREILALAAVNESEADDHIPAVIGHLEGELAAAEELLRHNGRVLPGVTELLAILGEDPETVQTVVTGNTAANAAAKLAAFGLSPFIDLDIGAFGSDNPDRNQLVPLAMQRARTRRRLDIDADRTWVVGDTPHDLACARAAGVRCLLVGTGRIELARLEGAGADAVLPDLSDVDRVLAILRS